MILGALTITEPATLLTDYVLAGLAAWFAVRLGREGASAHSMWWSRAFAFTAGSAVFGGTHHGLQEILPGAASEALWRASLAAASLSAFATMRAASAQWLDPALDTLLGRLALAKLVASIAIGVVRPEFLVVVVDFALTLLFLGVAAFLGRRRDAVGFGAAILGLLLFATGAAVQQGGLSPSASFNHNDLFHVIQILANGCFFVSAGGARAGPV